MSHRAKSRCGNSPKSEFEWMELFEENKKKAMGLQREIEKTDAEIDRMVYELCGLTEAEIWMEVINKLKNGFAYHGVGILERKEML